MAKKEPEKPKAVAEVAAFCAAAERTVQKWAAENGVFSVGGQYLFFDVDIERFKTRARPGRRWKKGEKRKKS
jgi:hypothetical protein